MEKEKDSLSSGPDLFDEIKIRNNVNDTLEPPNTDGEPERGNWGSPIQFVLACVGYAVGLGNVWRFPHLVYRNGGGAFLVPYILMVFVIGLPIFFAELFVGQYGGLGPIKAYTRLAPFFHGLGYCTLVVITFVTIYYMVIIAWIIFYFFASCLPTLGWGSCSNDFNTDSCYSGVQDQDCIQNNNGSSSDMIYWLRRCTTIADICQSKQLASHNGTYCFNSTSTEYLPVTSVIHRVLASEEYYYQNVLGIGDATWYNFGYPRWQLVLCLALGWIIAFLCLIKGIKSAGKVVYFTALFPYVILTALLVRGVTLPGAVDGVLFYIRPRWESLKEPSVWGDAASQIFYSFGLACGSLVSFSSYNKFRNNCHTDALVVSATNVFTAVFAGFAVFSVLGFMAKNLGSTVDEVVQGGPGLAFIAYPEAILLMPLPHLWSILFFLMMFILGMGSQFGGIEAMCTAVIDQWPHLRDHHWKVTAGVCLFCFLAALPMVCNGGIYMFTLLDWHTASWAILLLGTAEVVVISWVYGIQRTFDNLADMNIRFHKIIRAYWWAVWVVLTPVASVAVFVFVMTDIGPTEFGEYEFPRWADSLGWLMGASTLAPFVFFLIYNLIKGTRGWALFKSSPKWVPQEGASQQTNDVFTPTAPPENGIDNIAYENN
ncbi:sodium- and chloride-dependent GABA transporter 2-like [Bradysia coprophila]|uniref:sodium- and chloride-dependent GABA transporter 2-like n=1 Tax=Bradysia coprophila TaxID=38358 RepID=UPI00187DA6D6|nr:sodium- and chloride-dependent GABA transporter 2-like [Bradysia coprophila]